VRPGLEFLEERLTLTGNIAITGVSVVDANNEPLTTVNVGDWVYIQADFTTQDLASNASYRVGFTVNGLTLQSSYVTWGAGSSGTSTWDLYWGAFMASPGTNQVTAIVDPDHSVAETNYGDNTMSSTFNAVSPAVRTLSYTAAQIRDAYGINSIPDFGSAPADGSGQTIAFVEVGNDPSIINDLDGFDRVMSLTTGSTETLYQQYGLASSFVNVYNQDGTNITANIANSGTDGVPTQDPTGHWEGEETLDVEWAHAIAPGAEIDIIEVNNDANWPTNLLAGDRLAAGLPGVSAISNSWGLIEWSGETAYDSSTFVTPSGHTGVTFLTASNDNGANVYWSPPSNPPPSVGNDGYYPATSPNVVSVGGTQLTLNNDEYSSETGWSYPAPESIVVNGGPSYTQSGPWASQSGGFSGTYSTAAGGSSSSAAWTISITPAITGWGTELSATWTASPTNATNATYTIYDGTQATGTILGTVVVNQTVAPVGTADGSSQLQELGVFFPTLDSSGDGTLTVVLNAQSANGTVVADAIGAAQAWASTGGPSQFESEPSYQLPFQSTGYRTTPDVSFDASQDSPVDTYWNGSLIHGHGFGTSLGSPCWAGLIAIANQGRVAFGGTTLNTPADPTQTLRALYSLPASDFHDITSGYNGFRAAAGYDEVTGRGSPIANLLIPHLANYGLLQLAPIAGQTVATGHSLTLTLQGSDPAGLPLTYSAVVDSLAYHLKSTLGLYSNGNYYTNWGGGGEQWVQGTGGAWYYILPSGGFYQWSGSGLTGTFVAQLDPSYNANPGLLVNAQPGQGQATWSVSGAVLTITPSSGFAGLLFVTAVATDGSNTASQPFQLTVITPPTLAAIADHTVPAGQSLTLTLQGNDSAGLPLTYSAGVDSLAYHLKSTLGLYSTGNYYTNWGGGGEQWVQGSGGAWYYILPSGVFYQWSGSGLTGTFVAQLDPSYNANPGLLVNAQPVQGQAAVSINGAVLTITPNPGFAGLLFVTATVSDGYLSASQAFQLTVIAPPTLAAIPDQTVATGHSLMLTLQGSDPDGMPLTYSAVVDSLAYHLKSTLGLYSNGNYYTNWGGGGEQWVQGTGGVWYYILPSGVFYQWSGSGLTGTFVAQLDPSYNANPSLLVNAQPGQGQATVGLSGAQVIITPNAGFTGVLYVTAMVTSAHGSASQTFKVTVTN
jgi:hypothetical protein